MWNEKFFFDMVHAMPPFPYRRDQSKNYFEASSDSFLKRLRSFSSSSDALRARVPAALFPFSTWRLASFENWSNNSLICANVFSMVIFLNVIQYFANIVKKSGIRLYCNIFVIVWYLLLSSPIYFPFRVFPDRVIGNSLRRDFIYKVSDKKWENRSGCNECRIIMWNTVICWCGGK